jgi:hypothetical protein
MLDFDDKELESPLKDFNATKPDKDDMLALCRMINRQNKVNPNSEDRLEMFFDRFWTDFLNGFTALMAKHERSKPSKPKPIQETLEKILETVEALLRNSQSKWHTPGFMPSVSVPHLTQPNVGISQEALRKALAQAFEWPKAINPEPSEPEQPSSKPPAG